MVTLDELKVQMSNAVKVFQESGDMSKIQEVTKAMDKAKADIAKEEAIRLQEEAKAMAGKREALAAQIHQTIRSLNLDKAITDVKGWGFVYKVDKANPSELDVSYKAVSLSTAVVKVRQAGGGNGGAGKSKDEYGSSLAELFDKFATAEDKAKITAIDADTTITVKAKNSKKWIVKVDVKKAAIAAGKLAPVK